jgi:hypothetical protein
MSRSRDTVTVYLFKKREKSKKSPQIKRFGDFSLAEKERFELIPVPFFWSNTAKWRVFIMKCRENGFIFVIF